MYWKKIKIKDFWEYIFAHILDCYRTTSHKNYVINTLRGWSLEVLFYLAVNILIAYKMQNIFFFNSWTFCFLKYTLNKLDYII